MHVVIRADASLQIGTGHVMRCLTLADDLRGLGAEAAFLCRDLPGHLGVAIAARGFPVHWLPAPAPAENLIAYECWLGVTVETDAQDSAAVLAGLETRPDWLVVDHYALDARWEKRLRDQVGQIMVIDDLADRTHDCDLLLDQNYHPDARSRYAGLLPGHCRLLLGPQHALLRPEFLRACAHPRERDGHINRILVFLGGVDADNVTGRVLEALEATVGGSIRVDVILGAANPHRQAIESRHGADDRFNLHTQVSNMAEFMQAADLAIGACGSATWERCCLGLPSLVLVLADNQRQVAEELARAGAVINLGEVSRLETDVLAAAIRDLMNDPQRLRALSQCSLALMGDKPSSVAEAMIDAANH